MATKSQRKRDRLPAPVEDVSGEIEVCCHRVSWWYRLDGEELTEELRERLQESAEERAREMISQDYREGELCYCEGIGEETKEFHGWWAIET